jgi:hypothetical protein
MINLRALPSNQFRFALEPVVLAARLCEETRQIGELLLRNECLAAENHILKSQIKGRLRLSDGERATLAGIAKRLGRKALQESFALPNRIRSSPGIGNSSLRNSTARRNAASR